MVSCDLDKVVIKGAMPLVMCEMENLLSHFREVTEEKIGKEQMEKAFDEIVKNSKKTEEELKEEVNQFTDGVSADVAALLNEFAEKLAKKMLEEEENENGSK